MGRLIGITFLIGVALSIVPFLIEKYGNINKRIKYAVPALLFLLSIVFWVMAKWFSTGMQDLANMIMAFIAFGSGFIVLISCIVTDRLFKKR